MPINLSLGIIGEDNVEIPDLSVKALLKHSLTHRARSNVHSFQRKKRTALQKIVPDSVKANGRLCVRPLPEGEE